MSVIIDGKESYVGCVINIFERNGYQDSDFYATVIDVETGKTIDIEYDSTRHGGHGNAFIDVTKENYRKYLHNAKWNFIECCVDYEAKQAKRITKGKVVKVVKGRKVPVGTTGEVFWTKDVTYGIGYQSNEVTRIGIKDKEGNIHWTYAHNVEVVDYKRYMRSSRDIIKYCKRTMCNKYMSIK